MSYPTYTRRRSGGGAGWMLSAFLIVIVPLTLFNGWVLSVMWNWFVPNIFTGLPSLTVGTAIGLSLVISAFLYIPPRDDKDDDPWAKFITALLTPVLRGLLLLALGAIVHGIVF